MTNNEIIYRAVLSEKLMTEEEAKKILESGQRLPYHTYREWSRMGYQVKQGEKAVLAVDLWKASTKKVEIEEDGEEAETLSMYIQKAFLFGKTQVEPKKKIQPRSKEELKAYNQMLAAQRREKAACLNPETDNLSQHAQATRDEAEGGQLTWDAMEQAQVNQEPATQPKQETPAAPQATATYYTINESAARRAKNMNSFSDYREGSATAEYRHYVDEAFTLAQAQKKRVDPMYHEKIDSLFDTYARKLAANMNHGYEIDSRVPSILIAGGSNFPVRKKEKQNAARDRNMQEWKYIQGLLDKIQSVGMGGISSDDPQALEKLKDKLSKMEKNQEKMKAANAAIRMKNTDKGNAKLSDLGYTPAEIEKLREPDYCGRIGYPSYALSNNNANIHRVRERIEQLEKREKQNFSGWDFDGGKVEANISDNRLQILFDEKPDEAIRERLKGNGFHWSPRLMVWQRQLNGAAIRAARHVLQP